MWGIGHDKVLDFIRNGELVAFIVASKNSRRPLFKIGPPQSRSGGSNFFRPIAAATQEPLPNMIGHLPQRTLGDMLPVNGTLVGCPRCMAHDMIDRHLIAGLAADGLARTPQPIEPQSLNFNAHLFQATLDCRRDGVV